MLPQGVTKQERLLARLQTLLHGGAGGGGGDSAEDSSTALEVLDYFLQRLSSQQTQHRLQAVKVSVRDVIIVCRR